ncbi:hypothetical protein AAZX31_12G144700 [Glycine max]
MHRQMGLTRVQLRGRCWLILIRLMHSYCKVRTDLVFFFTLNHFSAEVEKLSSEEQGLDDQIRPVHFCKLNETLIAIKALHGTTLEVPNPEEAVDHRERRYKIILRSTMGPLMSTL